MEKAACIDIVIFTVRCKLYNETCVW